MCRSLGISHALRLYGGGRLLAEPILSVSLKDRGIEGWDGEGGETDGGWGTHTSMADSCECMAKTTTILSNN